MLKNFHLIGIGGISMSALAKMLQNFGYNVTGSDINPKVHINGICTAKSKAKKNINNADIVVVSSAIKPNDKELLFARKLNKTIWSRAKLLAEISKKYKNIIAISGTHGKTTTTEMIAECFLRANKNPTIHLGGISKKFNSNYLIGNTNFFITEACEYSNSFLELKPSISVITNIEKEHLDFFKTFENEKNSFMQFAKNSKVVIAHKNSNIKNSNQYFVNKKNNKYKKTNKNKIKNNKKNIFYATNIKKYKNGYKFNVYKNDKFFIKIKLNSILKENIDNALACIMVCNYFHIPKQKIYYALKNFCGTKRRLEQLEKSPIVFHDYAHHPTEIQSVIKSVKNFYHKKIIVVFEPHTYSRTKTLFGDFLSTLKLANKIYILKTYPAREKYSKSGSAKTLAQTLKKNGLEVHYFSSYKKCKSKLKKDYSNTNIILILGAGNINKLW